jgi:hypothetical protein
VRVGRPCGGLGAARSRGAGAGQLAAGFAALLLEDDDEEAEAAAGAAVLPDEVLGDEELVLDEEDVVEDDPEPADVEDFVVDRESLR